MQRKLKRVPLDFDYPLNAVWHGYNVARSFKTCLSEGEKCCEHCRKMAELKGIPFTSYGCPDNERYYGELKTLLDKLCEPPKGVGYQLWETVSEGSPVSPVFETLEQLCEWCESSVTVWANEMVSKEEWMRLLSEEEVELA